MTLLNETAEVARNKSRIHEFYKKIYNGRDLTALADFVSEDYIEHNPEMESGRFAFEAFLNHIFHALPEIEFSVERLIAENDLVAVHTIMRKTPSDNGSVISEFFRLHDGIIVERWDVTMPVPATSKNKQPLI